MTSTQMRHVDDRHPRRRLTIAVPAVGKLLSVGSLIAACLTLAASAEATHFVLAKERTSGVSPRRVRPLQVISVPTPPLPVRRYDTSGTFPQVRLPGFDLRAVNAGLQAGVLADQHDYAPSAQKAAAIASSQCRGIYKTSVARLWLSASSVVVSSLMPATQLYPCGNEGRGWVAVTVLVPSGKRVTIADLFADSRRALPALRNAWYARLKFAKPGFWRSCVRGYQAHYRATAANLRYFALTPRGLALGFWQVPACERSEATVAYAVIRPYLSALGERLVAGVRRPVYVR